MDAGTLQRIHTGLKLNPRRINIKSNLTGASLAYREILDFEVSRCVALARFLIDDLELSRDYFEGEFVEYFTLKGGECCEALRWVLLRAFVNKKKASKIYNATRVMFDEGVSAEEFPARVRAAGGYEKLASANSKERSPVVETDVAGSHKSDGSSPADAATPSNVEPKADADEVKSSATEGIKKSNKHAPMIVECTFEGSGHEFLKLPFPCKAELGVHIDVEPAGQLAFRIFSAKRPDFASPTSRRGLEVCASMSSRRRAFIAFLGSPPGS